MTVHTFDVTAAALSILSLMESKGASIDNMEQTFELALEFAKAEPIRLRTPNIENAVHVELGAESRG